MSGENRLTTRRSLHCSPAHRASNATNGAETITRFGAASRVTQTLPLIYPGRLTDDRIVELVDALPNRTMALIYTSDAGLGAQVAGARSLLNMIAAVRATTQANSRRLAHSPAADGPGHDHGLEGSVLSGSGLPIITAALCADAIGGGKPGMPTAKQNSMPIVFRSAQLERRVPLSAVQIGRNRRPVRIATTVPPWIHSAR